jgi:hypothetical protein
MAGHQLLRIADPCPANVDVGQGGTSKEQSLAGAGADASTAGRVHAEMESPDAVCEANRLGVPIVPAEREAASRCEHARIQLSQTGCRQGGGNCRGLGGPVWLSQLPSLARVVPGTVEDRSEDRASSAQALRCKDHAAALLAQRERGSDAGAGRGTAGNSGQQNGRKRTESGLSSFVESELKPFEMWWPGTELNRRRQLFRAAYYQRIPLVLQ